jgi:23S rRNA pseudouridine1911/1915/1917 synthase
LEPVFESERTVAVAADGAGERLDRYVAARWPDISRSRLTQLIDERQLLLDGRPAKPSVRLKVGAVIHLTVPPPIAATPQPEELELSVLYDDPDLLVVNKAVGMVVHPAAGVDSGTLVNALLFHVKDLAGIGGELRPGIVHRLDRDTSGAMVVAKNDFALAGLQRGFHDREVEKQYLAICHGVPAPSGTIDTPFGRHHVDRVRMTGRLQPDDPSARRAVTHFKRLESFGDSAAMLTVQLETGRTHQIRVHLSEAGFPLLADKVYGGTKRDARAPAFVREAAVQLGRQALHAHVLAFKHPRSGALIRCVAPVPDDMERALAQLRRG